MLECEEVDEVLGHTKSLLQVLDDTVSRCKTLVAVIEESQWQSAQLVSEHSVLHSVTGQLADAYGAGQSLCKELLQFKFKLGTLSDAGSFYERIQASIEQKKDELEESYAVIQMERNALDEERGISAKSKGKCKKCSSKENEETRKTEEGSSQTTPPNEKEEGQDGDDDCVEEILMWQLKLQVQKTGDALDAKEAAEKDLRVVSDQVQSQRRSIEALETGLLAMRENYDGAQNSQSLVNLRDAECQTMEVTTSTSCSSSCNGDYHASTPTLKDKRSSLEMLFYGQLDEGNTESDRLLSSRQSSRPNRLTPVQQVSTVSVSRARANLLLRQGHLTRLIKALLEENARLKEDLQKLKVDNTSLSKKAKEAASEAYSIKNQLSVYATDKEGLQKKMQKIKDENHKLQNALKKQANGFVQSRKQQEQFEEEIRWSQIPALSRIGSEKRIRKTSREEKSTRNIQTPRW